MLITPITLRAFLVGAGITATVIHRLHYGLAECPPLARIIPDDRHRAMWRIAWPDGRVSDMTNISRAKDAAAVICQRGPPARHRDSFHWATEHIGQAAAAPPMRKNGGGHG